MANVRPGLHGLTLALPHPDGRRVVVVARGDLWEIDPSKRTGVHSLPAILSALEVRDPDGWVFSRQDIALARLGPKGLLWHTRRLSLDGFDQLRIENGSVVGLAWTPEVWQPFRVDLRTGKSEGGWRDSFLDMEELGDRDGER